MMAGRGCEMKGLRGLYRRVLQDLCRHEMRTIADDYPHTREDLIKYYDYLAIECIDEETKSQERLLGISISTANLLDDETNRAEVFKVG